MKNENLDRGRTYVIGDSIDNFFIHKLIIIMGVMRWLARKGK
ncbi:MAG: hypothetical protein ACXQT5_01120 [Candidatus Syntropharchaeia archaeon]